MVVGLMIFFCWREVPLQLVSNWMEEFAVMRPQQLHLINVKLAEKLSRHPSALPIPSQRAH